jgi:hypothetical protein
MLKIIIVTIIMSLVYAIFNATVIPYVKGFFQKKK